MGRDIHYCDCGEEIFDDMECCSKCANKPARCAISELAPASGWTNWRRGLLARWPEGLAMLASALFVEERWPVIWLWIILWMLFNRARSSSIHGI